VDLFETLDELKPFIFRIVDNGGETYDRFTIVTCDGDGILATGGGSICTTVEGVDVQRIADEIESGESRELRWIDLPADLQRRLLGYINSGFADWLGDFTPARTRAEVKDNGTGYTLADRFGEGVYGELGAYYIRRETYPDDGKGSDDLGPYATVREAVLDTVPADYDLSGPEYHAEVDLWDTEGGPAELWDREADPPHPYEVALIRDDGQTTADNPHWLHIGEARDLDHGREIARQWMADNPDRPPLYRAAMGGKADRTFHTLEL